METEELLIQFFDEANELLDDMENQLLEIDANDPDIDMVNAIFRAAHSIKGGAGIFGFERLQRTTHILENLLDKIRRGEIPLSTDLVNCFLSSKDILKDQLSAYKNKSEPDESEFLEICSILEEKTNNPESSGSGSPSKSKREPSLVKVIFKKVSDKDRPILLSELATFGPIVQAPSEETPNELILDTDEDVDTISMVMSLVVDSDDIEIVKLSNPEKQTEETQKPKSKPSSSASAKTSSSGSEANTLRVPVDKVDAIINLVGELVITQSMLNRSFSISEGKDNSAALTSLAQLQRNARDLQEAVMSIRMVPMDSVFSRFPRQIRDLAGKLNKQVDLVTEGKSTELDKSLVEKIVDPLSHLVRNSLDHGIETPEKRVAAGKSPNGTLTLSAAHQGGNIVIQVIDDGAGLNREKLLAKAKSNGLPVSDAMSDDDVYQLIFAPGFSTAEVVSDVSGRGVGMDVVKRNIQSLGGQVQISSSQGKGTTTKIVLPLTMAILDGMSIRVGESVYILPLSAVIESMQPNVDHIFKMSGDGHVIRVRDEYLPIISLRELFSINSTKLDPADCIAVIVQSEGTKFALLVDDLVGEQQVVVKNLETNYQKVPGVSAATIMGDGSVAFILDIIDLQRISGKAKQTGSNV